MRQICDGERDYAREFCALLLNLEPVIPVWVRGKPFCERASEAFFAVLKVRHGSPGQFRNNLLLFDHILECFERELAGLVPAHTPRFSRCATSTSVRVNVRCLVGWLE